MARFVLVLLMLSIVALVAQGQSVSPDVWASAGGYYASSDGSVTWTLGETLIETHANPGMEIIVTQGFNQPYLKQTTTGTNQTIQDNSPVFTVFPNPTSGFIRIKLSKPIDKPVQVELYNTLGQLIQSDLWLPNTAAPEMVLSLENQANGVYFLQVTMAGESLGVYKVQKDHH